MNQPADCACNGLTNSTSDDFVLRVSQTMTSVTATEKLARKALTVDVIVKTLNEENNIEECLASIFDNFSEISFNVIVVDSNSEDRTVDIAKRFPVKIVQFAKKSDRGCGAAIQLGYQASSADFILLIDGDMKLQPGFVGAAINILLTEHRVAGVGGAIIDETICSPADRRRSEYYSSINTPILVDDLGGGGIYRRSAIDPLGYISNRWLMACEELELGLRLNSSGWKLVRLPIPSVRHRSHGEDRYKMLSRLWRNGRMRAYGILLKQSIGKPWFFTSVKRCWFGLMPYMMLLVSCFAFILARHLNVPFIFASLGSLVIVWSLALAIMILKRRSFEEGAFALISWHAYGFSMLRGLFSTVGDPLEPIDGVTVSSS